MGETRRWRRAAVAAGLVVPALFLASCSGGASSSTAGGASSESRATPAASTSSASGTGTSGSGSPSGAGLPGIEQLFEGDEGTPPSSSPSAAKDKDVYWISCGQQAPGCAAYAAAGQEAAEAIGWRFHLLDGNLNQANGYATAVRTALAAQPDAIVQDAFSCSTDQPELQRAKDQGVAVIGVETTDCSDAGVGPELFTVPMVYSDTYPDNKTWWTGWGQRSAEFLAADSGGQGKIITNFGQGDPQFDFLKAGFEQEMAKCAGCEVVADVPWTVSDLAPDGPWVTALRNALLQHPEATYVWWPFDNDAGQGTVAKSGTTAKLVSGIGTAGALDQIRSGQMYAEGVARDSDWVSWAAIDQLNRHFNGQPSVPQGLGFVAVTKDHNLPAQTGEPYRTAVDYQSLYKKAWGVS